MSGRAEAQKLVEAIGESNGYIPASILDKLPQEDRDRVVKTLESLKHKAASSVKTLAQNLYSSSAKFVFELLQNYDDNKYTRASGPPRVSFQIYPNQIKAACNEDGFTAQNVEAICNVGKSSKKRMPGTSGGAGYIGEKGIGFKSVFMAAEAVHIQSGDYSFGFEYPKGDSGMGMIAPIWMDHDEHLDAQLSHITLKLRSDGRPGDVERRREIILKQFHDIHDSILLFMKKIEQIEVAFYDRAGVSTSITSFSIDRRTVITAVKKSTKTFDVNRTETVSEVVRRYYTSKCTVRGLAPNENREDLDSELPSGVDSEGQVVLGFPLDENSVPVLQNEYLFAFLPIKQMGFKFLIHADFVTQANREDIVTTSERNRGLARGIERAFINAVLWFCEHDTLQYQWMRYLPQDDDRYPWNRYWKDVIEGIRDQLKRTPVMQPENPLQPLRLLSASRRLPSFMMDSDGKPLVADIVPNCYLSLRYQEEDLLLLETYGLTEMLFNQWLVRVRHDLAAPNSTMKSTANQDWHSRVAYLLNYALESSSPGWRQQQPKVRELGLLPLRDGRWVSINSGPVYYPYVGVPNLGIPLDLDLDVVDFLPAINAARKQLFDNLGVQTPSVDLVRRAILRKYQEGVNFNISNIVAHLRFLYLSHHLAQPPYHYSRLYLLPEIGGLQRCDSVDFYLPNDDPYGASKLLAPTAAGTEPGCGAPGLPVFIMVAKYFENESSPPTRNSLSWKDWLHTFLGVRRHLRLLDADGTTPSAICNYVARHRPEKFLGFLQATWGREGPTLANQKAVVDKLRGVEVLCRGGSMRPLHSTYLPIKRLEQLCSHFLDDEFFPWLRLEVDFSSDETLPLEWVPLGKAFGLGFSRPDLDFLLDVLEFLQKAHPSPNDLPRVSKAYELYICLQAEVRKSGAPNEREKPSENFPDQFRRDRSILESFFSKTLQIPNCSWEDLIEEIKDFRESDSSDFDRINALYGCLSKLRLDLSATELRNLKEIFKTDTLICGFDTQTPSSGSERSWHRTDKCLWTSATRIRGMLTLNELYPELRDFFVKGLGVQTMTAKMVYDKLLGPALSVEETKQTIETFNSLLLSSSSAELRKLDAAAIVEKAVFPVRLPNGDIELRKGSDGFALLDRQSLGDKFAGQAAFLDFGIDEVRTLQPFLAWAGLREMYLSKMVKEISGVVAEDSKRPISSRDRDISSKARALLSLAVAYNSPRTNGANSTARRETFYALLRSAETLETNGITSELHLHQNGQLLKVERAAATVHIQEDAASLKIYVPRNKTRQELCFNGTLPQLFCEWVMTDPATQIREPLSAEAVNATQAILCAKRIAMRMILDHWGIKYLSVLDGDEDEDEDEEEDDGEELDEPRTPVPTPAAQPGGDGDDGLPGPGPSNLNSGWREARGDAESGTEYSTTSPSVATLVLTPDTDDDTDDEVLYITSAMARSNLAPAVRPVLQQPPLPVSAVDDSYSVLLGRLVGAAGSAVFPARGVISRSGMSGAPGPHDYRWLRSASLSERYKQIGAAGELFVFELLSHLDPPLPGFALHNWQSTIRDYARSHAAYANISGWTGHETADITYTDADGMLTSLLIDRGYLTSDVWAGARPNYFIEVKTTMNAAIGTPFYMSSHQYERMQNYSYNNGEQKENVYVVVRVFGLGGDSVGFKVLVDPESMRRRGELAFTAPESWSVVVL